MLTRVSDAYMRHYGGNGLKAYQYDAIEHLISQDICMQGADEGQRMTELWNQTKYRSYANLRSGDNLTYPRASNPSLVNESKK